jgi:pilus assembly protein CpaB
MTREALSAPSSERNGRLFLYAGLGLGVVAAILVAVLLSNATSDDTPTTPTTVSVVVAAQTIPAGQRITADMLEISVVKIEDAQAGAFSSAGQLTNRIAAEEIQSGALITPALLRTTLGSGLTLTIQPGMRGFSIPVAQITSAGGNVSVGDYVDVLLLLDTSEVQDNPAFPDLASISRNLTGNSELPAPLVVTPEDAPVTLVLTVLQNVRVLALDQTLTGETVTRSNGDSDSVSVSSGRDPQANTATLELTPQDVQRIALVSKYGSLSLSLRAFGDDTKDPVAPIAAGF